MQIFIKITYEFLMKIAMKITNVFSHCSCFSKHPCISSSITPLQHYLPSFSKKNLETLTMSKWQMNSHKIVAIRNIRRLQNLPLTKSVESRKNSFVYNTLQENNDSCIRASIDFSTLRLSFNYRIIPKASGIIWINPCWRERKIEFHVEIFPGRLQFNLKPYFPGKMLS